MKYPNKYCYNAVINSYSTMPYYDVINNIKNHIIGLKVVLNVCILCMCGLLITFSVETKMMRVLLGQSRGSQSCQMTVDAPSCQ